MKIAVVIFCYLRAQKFRNTLNFLSLNIGLSDYQFYVYQDGLRNSKDKVEHELVKEYWDEFVEENSIKYAKFVRSKENLGLRDSILKGVSNTLKEFDAVIVLEDDLQVHKNFLHQLSSMLREYKDDENIYHVNAWSPPVLIPSKSTRIVRTKMMFCWGWGTWSDKWDGFAKSEDFERKNIMDLNAFIGDFMGLAGFRRQLRLNFESRIRTWAVFWYWYLFLNRKFCIGPNRSLVRNTGNDGTGENCGEIDLNTNIQSIFDGEVQYGENLVPSSLIGNGYYAVNLYLWLFIRDTIMVIRKIRRILLK